MRYQVEWKSDDYGINETTSIQTGRRGADTEQASPTPKCGEKKKFKKDISGAKSTSPTPGTPAQGSSARKISLHNFWLQKSMGIELVEETAGAPSSFS